MKNLFRSLLFTLLVIPAFAQDNVKVCGLGDHMEELFARRPHTRVLAEQDDRDLEEWTQNRSGSSGTVYIIPVVFHIIHDNGPENISDEQVFSAVETLNTDFRKLDPDIEYVIEDFQDITADIEIEFRLAQLDEFGNCTNGITRTAHGLTYVGDSEMKELIQWPREMYLNVWVCAYANGAAGYALYPGSVNNPWNADQDGIVLRHDYCGSIGTSAPSRRRTLVHEVGHWLNLRHCWGNSNDAALTTNCEEDDNVNDTPETIGWQSCGLYGESCGTLDNVQNYMEYSGCRLMFTEGQKTRMRNALESGTAQRSNLWTQNNRENTGTWLDTSVLCNADFGASSEVVCVNEEMQFFDESYNGITEWSWDFGDGTTLEGTDPEIHMDPVHTYTEPGQYTVSLMIGNGVDVMNETKTSFISVLPPNAETTPLAQGFEDDFPGNNWWIHNPNDDEGWEVTSDASYDGDKCIKLNNNTVDINFANDEFVSSTFDFSEATEVTISYKWAYANRLTETGDRLRIHISFDCGQTWILKKQHTGTNDLPSVNATNQSFVPSSQADWDSGSILIDNPAQLTESFRVKFSFLAMGGNNIYVDNINIESDAPVGIGEMTGAALSIYPNPAQDHLNITGQSLTEYDFMDVFNANGALITSMLVAEKNMLTLDTSTLAKGLYVLRARSADGQFSQRFVVE